MKYYNQILATTIGDMELHVTQTDISKVNINDRHTKNNNNTVLVNFIYFYNFSSTHPKYSLRFL